MRLSSRRELYKLRELTSFLLVGEVCWFCRKALSETAERFAAHGNSTGPKFTDRITIHHIDGNHDNDVHENKTLSHTSCHKGHHRREANIVRSMLRKQKEKL